ncbi:MAG: hypothetical protein VYA30_00980 [Myxococcota bacterium]|nr:hypothetical protein [Myxococcota bacterium]
MIKLTVVFLLLLCAGCGVGLSELERQQYDELAKKEDALTSDLARLQAEELSQFNELSRLERRVKRVAKGVLSCQLNLKGQDIGPLPFRFKKGYRVGFTKQNLRAPQGCQHWSLRVVK